jgi:hypothetical protein
MAAGSLSVLFKHYFIDVTPHPIFAGLDGADNGVLGGVEMLGGVLVFGVIATADVPANEAKAQMNPAVAHLQTFLAAFGLRLNGANLVGMRTSVSHAASGDL